MQYIDNFSYTKIINSFFCIFGILMNIEQLYLYCKSLPQAEECFPFDEETLVFKVFGKMFALLDMEKGDRINLKCEPLKAEELREKYSSVLPGYHMNKKHWNTILLTGELKDELILSLVKDSYYLVVTSLPKKFQFLCEKN